MALRDSWKETGKGLGHAFTSLGKSIVKTAKYAADKAEDWADSDSDAASTDAASTDDGQNKEAADTDSRNS